MSSAILDVVRAIRGNKNYNIFQGNDSKTFYVTGMPFLMLYHVGINMKMIPDFSGPIKGTTFQIIGEEIKLVFCTESDLRASNYNANIDYYSIKNDDKIVRTVTVYKDKRKRKEHNAQGYSQDFSRYLPNYANGVNKITALLFVKYLFSQQTNLLNVNIDITKYVAIANESRDILTEVPLARVHLLTSMGNTTADSLFQIIRCIQGTPLDDVIFKGIDLTDLDFPYVRFANFIRASKSFSSAITRGLFYFMLFKYCRTDQVTASVFEMTKSTIKGFGAFFKRSPVMVHFGELIEALDAEAATAIDFAFTNESQVSNIFGRQGKKSVLLCALMTSLVTYQSDQLRKNLFIIKQELDRISVGKEEVYEFVNEFIQKACLTFCFSDNDTYALSVNIFKEVFNLDASVDTYKTAQIEDAKKIHNLIMGSQ